MTSSEINVETPSRPSRWRGWSAFALAFAGGMLIFYSVILVLQGAFAHWGWSKAAGQIVRVVRAEQGGRTAPVVVFADAEGRSHTVFLTESPRGASYAAGDAVSVLYDAREPSQAVIHGFGEVYRLPLLLAGAGAALLLIAASMSSPPEGLLALARGDVHGPPDPAQLQFHPFNAVSVKHYLAEAGAPDARRKVRITDASQALAQGRYPVALAEFLAYVSALAYRGDAAGYLARRLPRLLKPAQAEHDGTRALMFLFEGHAVIALADTKLARPWSQLRQLVARRAGAHALLPSDTVWDAAPRDYALAAQWDGLREAVENWLKSALPEAFEDAEDRERVRCLFTGHGAGGALAALGAYEFAKRGRSVTAVVTFGAPPVGGRRFASDYRDLGLDARTLDVRAQRDALPLMRWPWARSVPSLRWTLAAHWPLPARAISAGIAEAPFLARRAHRRLSREEARGLGAPRSLVSGMTLRTLSSVESARTVMLRHDIERRYCLPLSVAVQGRLIELFGSDPAAAAGALSDHLLDIRGVRPQDAHEAFLTLDGLPEDVERASPPAA